MQFKNILSNKYVLYVMVFVALTNVLAYLTIRDYNSLTFFFVLAFLSTYFSKNMTVALLVAVLGTNILFANNRYTESFEGSKEKGVNGNVQPPSGKCKLIDGKKAPKRGTKGKTGEWGSGGCDTWKTETDCEQHKDICKWNKEGFKGVPSSTPAQVNGDDSDDEGEGDRIDYAKTMEKAYQNLESMLGQDGIKKLSHQTRGLMKQQKELMQSFEGLQPLVKQAGGMLESLKNMPNLGKMTGMVQRLNSLTNK